MWKIEINYLTSYVFLVSVIAVDVIVIVIVVAKFQCKWIKFNQRKLGKVFFYYHFA